MKLINIGQNRSFFLLLVLMMSVNIIVILLTTAAPVKHLMTKSTCTRFLIGISHSNISRITFIRIYLENSSRVITIKRKDIVVIGIIMVVMADGRALISIYDLGSLGPFAPHGAQGSLFFNMSECRDTV
jgi:hypothetical protein